MSITGILNVDNTITGVEDLYLDELDVNTIVLGGTDLQTTLTDLQNQITSGGGYFQVLLERNGAATSVAYFSCGANANAALFTYLPNCVNYGIAISYTGTITSAVDVDVIINSVTYTYVVPTGTNGAYTDYNLNISVSQGQTLQAKFGTNLGAGGGNYRITLFCRTSAVNGTNGTNGTNGQNVSFDTPTITTITPATSASINDTIVTSAGTQTHSLNFNIPRGKNSSFQVGTISSVGTASPTLDITQSTNGNGDNVYTMNFGLQQGEKGDKGDKGDKGNQGDDAESTIASIAAAAVSTAAATAAGASAIAAAASASAAASAGAAAGTQAGSQAAEAVLAEQNGRITQLEIDMDAEQFKTTYIDRAGYITTIGGTRTTINSTNGLLTNTMEADSIDVSDTINSFNLNVVGQSYFANDITLADTKSLNTNTIRQRQYPAAGDMLIDATNLDIGSSFCDSIDVIGDSINITTNSSVGFTTFNCGFPNTDTQVLIEGSLEAKNLIISNNATINNNLLIQEDLTAGTDGEFNEHILYGTIFTQTIEVINNALPLNIGEDTDELQLLSNNIAIGNLEVGESQTLINNKNISIGETLANSVVNIGGANSKITCNGTTNTITIDGTNINIGNPVDSILDIDGDTINIGTAHINNTCNINPTTLNIVTNGTNAEVSTLNIGSQYCNTDIEANNLNIQGSTINIGTSGIANVVNVGNAFSSVNINTIDTEFLNIENYINQLGF
jgi:hypothetical protein